MEKNQTIIFVIILSIILFLLCSFILSVLLFQRSRANKFIAEKIAMQQAFAQQLLQSQLETQEETMSMLGKELHDNVAQLLSSTKMLLGVTERNLENPPDTLIVAEDTLTKAISEVRSLARSLDKDWLQQFNCIDNLIAEVVRINTSKKITIGFQHPNKLYIDADKQIVLFRIIQEAIQNTLKHAKANIMAIVITENDELLTVAINDDGVGFNLDTITKGMGISNIDYRTAVLGGKIQWTSNTNGTKVFIELPVENVL